MSKILKAWKDVDGEIIYIEEGASGEGIIGPGFTRVPGSDRVVSDDLLLSEDFALSVDTYTKTEVDTQQASQDSTIATEIVDRQAADTSLQNQVDSNDIDITELQTNQNDIITLTGTAENDTNLGTFTGNKIDNDLNIKEALQDLETELEIHEQTINNHSDVDVVTTVPVNTNILRFDGTNWIPSRERQFTQLSGRFEIDSDSDWACWSDSNFGPSLQDWDLDLADNGPNQTPDIDWDGMGLLFPLGATLKRIFVKCRGNNGDIDTVEFFARVHDVALENDLPIDSNGEIGAFDITPLPVQIDLDAGLGNANDIRGFEVSLNDYTFNNTGDLHVMMRAAVGSLTGNRQLRTTIFIEWELPI